MRNDGRLSHGSGCRGVLLLGVWLLLLAGCGGGYSPAPEAHDLAYYKALEQAVFDETNRLRVIPSAYVEALEERRRQFRGKVYYRPGDPAGILTNEGRVAVDEAMSVLRRQSPLRSLNWSEELAALARAHVADTGRRGLTGHRSSAGASFVQRVATLDNHASLSVGAENISYGMDSGRDVVLQLVVDDGVASRGHRENLLRQRLRYSGVGCGYHRQYGSMCVVIYAYDKG